jgi:RHS repeat-associated protein
LKDALGSTIALVDSSGNLQTSYTYDPYGGTSVTGTANGNEFQYTGRENEGTGLYFYRARYYSSLLGRFISEDPLGFAGSGANLYAYVFNSPTNLVDPFGLQTVTSPTVTAPYPGTPTAEEVEEALQSVQRATAAEEAAAATTAGTGTTLAVGGTLVAGTVATGAIVYYGSSAAIAVHHENQAYENELQAIHQMNLVLLAHPRPLSLAGRKNGTEEPEEDECQKKYLEDTAWYGETFTDDALYDQCMEIALFNRDSRCRQGLPPVDRDPRPKLPYKSPR